MKLIKEHISFSRGNEDKLDSLGIGQLNLSKPIIEEILGFPIIYFKCLDNVYVFRLNYQYILPGSIIEICEFHYNKDTEIMRVYVQVGENEGYLKYYNSKIKTKNELRNAIFGNNWRS